MTFEKRRHFIVAWLRRTGEQSSPLHFFATILVPLRFEYSPKRRVMMRKILLLDFLQLG